MKGLALTLRSLPEQVQHNSTLILVPISIHLTHNCTHIQKWLWSRYRITQQHFTHLLHNTRRPSGMHPSHLLSLPVRMLADHTHTQKKLLQEERVLAEKWWQILEQSYYSTTGYVGNLRWTSWQGCHIPGSMYLNIPSLLGVVLRLKQIWSDTNTSIIILCTLWKTEVISFFSLSGCYSLALLLC